MFDKQKLESFIDSFDSRLYRMIDSHDTNGKRNALYYRTFLSNSKDVFSEEVQGLSFYSECSKELDNYALSIKSCFKSIFEFYIELSETYLEQDKNIVKTFSAKNWRKYFNLEQAVDNLNHNSIVVRVLSQRDKRIANAYREFCVMHLQNTFQRLKNYGIILEKSPLNNKLNEIILNLKNAIDVKDIILENEINKLSMPEESESFDIDLSDSSGTEKIIALYKLGIIDFLKNKEPFNTSTNLLAAAISSFTGIKQGSVYPMINPMLNPTNNQKNNPLAREKTVKKVEYKLNLIGYKPFK